MLNSYKTFNRWNLILKYRLAYFKTQTQMPLSVYRHMHVGATEKVKKKKKPPRRAEVGLDEGTERFKL